MQLQNLEPMRWETEEGISQAHWSYRLTVRRGKAIKRYKCRFTTLHELMEAVLSARREEDVSDRQTESHKKGDDASDRIRESFPPTHWIPWLGKHFDTEHAASVRADQMVKSLRALLELNRPHTEKLIESLPDHNILRIETGHPPTDQPKKKSKKKSKKPKNKKTSLKCDTPGQLAQR